jgi:hypothetical protein
MPADGTYVVQVQSQSAMRLNTDERRSSPSHSYLAASMGSYIWAIFIIALMTGWGLVFAPRWRVWAQQKQGEVDLMQPHKSSKSRSRRLKVELTPPT